MNACRYLPSGECHTTGATSSELATQVIVKGGEIRKQISSMLRLLLCVIAVPYSVCLIPAKLHAHNKQLIMTAQNAY